MSRATAEVDLLLDRQVHREVAAGDRRALDRQRGHVDPVRRQLADEATEAASTRPGRRGSSEVPTLRSQASQNAWWRTSRLRSFSPGLKVTR